MQVDLTYAEEHLAELVSAAEGGQMVEIARPGKPALQLVLAGSQPLVPKSRGLWGSAKGKIWMAEDWDSPETNAEIAALFHGGPALSDESEG